LGCLNINVGRTVSKTPQLIYEEISGLQSFNAEMSVSKTNFSILLKKDGFSTIYEMLTELD
jgi:hypothetical protein